MVSSREFIWNYFVEPWEIFRDVSEETVPIFRALLWTLDMEAEWSNIYSLRYEKPSSHKEHIFTEPSLSLATIWIASHVWLHLSLAKELTHFSGSENISRDEGKPYFTVGLYTMNHNQYIKQELILHSYIVHILSSTNFNAFFFCFPILEINSLHLFCGQWDLVLCQRRKFLLS
jgi:hypothetical protein